MIYAMRYFTLVAGILAAAYAAVVPRITAEELVAQSERIVHGQVVWSWVGWDSEHKYIWTHYEVAVAETLRGPHAATITVNEPGGSLDGVNMQTSGTLPFTVGEDAVLFLYRTPIGYWRTVGGPQGKYTVSAQGRVRTDSQGMAYAEPTGGARPGASLAAFEGIPASDFLARVRRLVAAHPYRGGR
jgi:hypothetical protein